MDCSLHEYALSANMLCKETCCQICLLTDTTFTSHSKLKTTQTVYLSEIAITLWKNCKIRYTIYTHYDMNKFNCVLSRLAGNLHKQNQSIQQCKSSLDICIN